jgi:hypothetical protein
MTESHWVKPLWKRKRWIAAAVLWLVVLYPLSMGPFMYAFYMDWVPDAVMPAVQIAYGPLAEIMQRYPAFGEAMNDYCDWWHKVSVRHRPIEFASPPTSDGDGDQPVP